MSLPADNLFGVDLFGSPIEQVRSGELARRFLFPPFSVFDARQGEWQERKRAWLRLGIKGEIGRGVRITGNLQDASNGKRRYGVAFRDPVLTKRATSYSSCRPHQSRDAHPGREAGEYGGGDAWLASGYETGTSVFDPVLTEVLYSWFCPPGGQVVDPFAGGSVRGVVAAMLGLRYWGSELREVQVAANREQAAKLCVGCEQQPFWCCGDALDLLQEAPAADFVLTCPPYGDLERYSDDPRDLSTMEYHTFIATYKRVLLRTAKVMKRGAFLGIVVGDFRDPKTGNYRGFVADTICGCRDIGLRLYNDAVLLTPCGSLPIRAGKQFEASRKLGKTHQNVLVFRR